MSRSVVDCACRGLLLTATLALCGILGTGRERLKLRDLATMASIEASVHLLVIHRRCIPLPCHIGRVLTGCRRMVHLSSCFGVGRCVMTPQRSPSGLKSRELQVRQQHAGS